MKRFILATTLAMILAGCNDDSERYDYVIRQEEGVPEYGVIDQGGPVVLVFASDMDQTLTGKDTIPISQHLAAAEFTVVSMDLPSHRAGDAPHALSGWRARIDAGETTFFVDFCADVSAVLDHLQAQEASVVGISRGAYVAIICAALDERLRYIALLAPVTDLSRLDEFGGATIDPGIFGLEQYVPMLAGRKVLVRIGRQDDRVGTDAAVAFANSVGAELRVVNVRGHSVREDGSTTRWLLAQQADRR